MNGVDASGQSARSGAKRLLMERGSRAVSMFGYACLTIAASAVIAEIDARTLFLGGRRDLASASLIVVFAMGASWLAGRTNWRRYVMRALLVAAVASALIIGLLALPGLQAIGSYALVVCVGVAIAGILSYTLDRGSSRALPRLACNISAVLLTLGVLLAPERLTSGLESIVPVVALVGWVSIVIAVLLVWQPSENQQVATPK